MFLRATTRRLLLKEGRSVHSSAPESTLTTGASIHRAEVLSLATSGAQPSTRPRTGAPSLGQKPPLLSGASGRGLGKGEKGWNPGRGRGGRGRFQAQGSPRPPRLFRDRPTAAGCGLRGGAGSARLQPAPSGPPPTPGPREPPRRPTSERLPGGTEAGEAPSRGPPSPRIRRRPASRRVTHILAAAGDGQQSGSAGPKAGSWAGRRRGTDDVAGRGREGARRKGAGCRGAWPPERAGRSGPS